MFWSLGFEFRVPAAENKGRLREKKQRLKKAISRIASVTQTQIWSRQRPKIKLETKIRNK